LAFARPAFLRLVLPLHDRRKHEPVAHSLLWRPTLPLTGARFLRVRCSGSVGTALRVELSELFWRKEFGLASIRAEEHR
jgi:hypothetical protein